jgi:hypothetical protein
MIWKEKQMANARGMEDTVLAKLKAPLGFSCQKQILRDVSDPLMPST